MIPGLLVFKPDSLGSHESELVKNNFLLLRDNKEHHVNITQETSRADTGPVEPVQGLLEREGGRGG